MIKKAMFMLLAATLALSYASGQQPTQTDTTKVGALYLVNPVTFETKTGYVERVTISSIGYEPSGKEGFGADSLTLKKIKKPIAQSFYLSGPTWVKVQVIIDFGVDFTPAVDKKLTKQDSIKLMRKT